jgi:tape measure domain-containing protein
MSDLALKISANFEQAVKAFESLGQASEATQKRFQKFADGLKESHAEDFVEKQKRLEVAMLAAGRGSEAAAVQANNYQREIQRLINSGLSPESEVVKKLQGELVTLTEKTKAHEQAVKAQEQAVKAAQIALVAIGAATAAAAGLAVKAAANVEDMRAAFTPLMGSAEKAAGLVKQIQIEAADTPFEIDRISASVRSLLPAFQGSATEAVAAFKMIGDTAQGNSQKLESITSAYSKVMLKGTASMKEINQIANAGVPIYEQLAKSMGVSTAQMMKMSSDGKITSQDLAKSFQMMTSEGGIFFEGMKISSTTFNSTFLGVQERIGIAASIIGEEFLPAAKEIVTAAYDAVGSFMDWIQEGTNLEDMLDKLKIAIIAATAALATYVAVSKGAAAINIMTEAIKKLWIAISGPAGIAAIAIGGLVTAIGFGIKALQDMSTYQERMSSQFKDNKEKVESLLSSYEKLNPGKKIDEEVTKELLRLYPSLTGKIDANNTSVEEAVRLAREQENLQVRGYLSKQLEQLQSITRTVDSYAENLRNAEHQQELLNEAMAKEPGRDFSIEAEMIRAGISESKRNFEDVTRGFERTLEDANTIAALYGKKLTETLDLEDIPITITPTPPGEKAISGLVDDINDVVKSLSQRLGEIGLSDNQQLNEQINQVKSFLNQRAELERVSGDERIASYQRQLSVILESGKINADERLAVEKAAQEAVAEYQEKMSEEEAKRIQDLLKEQLAEFGKTVKQADGNLTQQRINDLREQQTLMLAQFEEGSAAFKEAKALSDDLIEEADRKMWEEMAQNAANYATQLLGAFSSLSSGILEVQQNNLSERVQNLKDATAAELKNENLTADQKKAIEEKLADEIEKANKEARDAAYSSAVFAKALSHAQAGINTALAATEALASAPPPINFALMAAVIAAGIAQQVQIATTPLKLPSAETGARFIVPQSVGSDSTLMRVNSGEEVDVTPRGMTGFNERQTITVQIEKQTIFDVVNDGIRGGDIVIQATNY